PRRGRRGAGPRFRPGGPGRRGRPLLSPVWTPVRALPEPVPGGRGASCPDGLGAAALSERVDRAAVPRSSGGNRDGARADLVAVVVRFRSRSGVVRSRSVAAGEGADGPGDGAREAARGCTDL